MNFLRGVIRIVFCVLLFAAVQFFCTATVGFLDWFFANLPASRSVWDYPVLYIFSFKPADYLLQGLPLLCLACSLLFFMKRKASWAYVTIIAPFFPSLFLMILFTFAAQMHVPPGQGLYGSGVLIGKVESQILKDERLKKERESAEAQEHGD